MYVDTHCHIIKQYYNNIDEVLDNASKAGVEKILICGYDLASNIEVLELAKKYDTVYAAIGFHPTDLDSFDFSFLEQHINDDNVVALGEIGFDYHYDNDVDTKKRQIEVFKKQIELALEHNKPVIIHSRDSIIDTYNVVSSYSNLRGSLHCYSGSLEMAKLFVKRGFLLGVGGVVTFKNAKIVKDVVKNIDLKYLLLETDSPYLAPEPHRGEVNTSTYIPVIAEMVASIKEIDISDVATTTTGNAYRLFDFQYHI